MGSTRDFCHGLAHSMLMVTWMVLAVGLGATVWDTFVNVQFWTKGKQGVTNETPELSVVLLTL